MWHILSEVHYQNNGCRAFSYIAFLSLKNLQNVMLSASIEWKKGFMVMPKHIAAQQPFVSLIPCLYNVIDVLVLVLI